MKINVIDRVYSYTSVQLGNNFVSPIFIMIALNVGSSCFCTEGDKFNSHHVPHNACYHL